MAFIVKSFWKTPNSRVTILDIDDKLLRIAKNRLSNSYYNNRIAFKKTSVYKTGIKIILMIL